MHESAVTNGSQDRWEGNLVAENFRSQVAVLDGDRVPGPENNLIESACVAAQGHFIGSSAIQVVEHNAWQPPPGQCPEILDVHNSS
jgi:hypothetical protein